MTFLYHLCAHDFRGTTLYPLNGLRTQFPDLYEREKQKWTGRESVLEYVVPGLNVVWADTVNLSALDPRLLLAERRSLGVPFSRLLERQLVCIPLDRVAKWQAVNYVSATHWLNSSPGDKGTPSLHQTASFPLLTPRSIKKSVKFLASIANICFARKNAVSLLLALCSFLMCL